MKMKKGAFNLLRNWISLFGDPRKILALSYFPRYISDWLRYRRLSGSEGLRLRDSFPCLADWTPYTPFDPHYFYQAIWLARHLAALKPSVHVDIGSSIVTIAATSAYVPTIFVDYRPLKVAVKGVFPVGANLLALPFGDGQLSSLSCLHVIEHIGLGRYGDPLIPKGTHIAAKELARVLAPGGKLFLSMPVGRERTQFNAQRIFRPSTIVAMFEGLRVESFGLIDDEGHLIQPAALSIGEACEYGCGLFEMTK
jgi:SAM-dependent methyltransferase